MSSSSHKAAQPVINVANTSTTSLRFRRSAVSLLLAAVFSNLALSNAVQAAADDAAIETISITGQKTNQSQPTRLPLDERQIPQSISSISAELMSLTNMLDINDVMMQVPGVNVTLYDTQRPLYFARGFQISDFQVDNIPTYSGNTNQEYDTALYERIEVIRGANGLFSGVGSPSATVNLLRKRPGKDFAASLSAGVGSWDLRRGVADLSTPFDDQGAVRGRFVLASLDADSFRDRYREKKLAGLAIVEADLSDKTTLAFGFQDQDNKPEGTIWGTVPIFAADGSLAEFPVSTSFAPKWTHWQRRSSTLFADVTHQFDNNWQLKAAVNRTEGEVSSLRVYATGFADKVTGQGLKLLAGVGEGEDTRTSLDLYLSGSYSAFGREHELIAGVSVSELSARTNLFTSVAGWSYTVPNAYAYDGEAPLPSYSKTGAYRVADTDQSGFYLANRFRLSEQWSVLGGARLSNWETGTDNFNSKAQYTSTTGSYKVSGELTPYVGLVWDLNEQHALYVSYTDIFTPQNYKDKNNNLLNPVLGTNHELGLKSLLLDGQLQLNAAVFKTAQDNYAVRDMTQPENSLPDGSSAYVGINGTESRGAEFSISGQLTDGWLLNAGYTYVDTKRHSNDKIWTNLPEHSAQLSSHYQLGGIFSGITLGAGLNWQSETIGYGLTHPQQKAGATFEQSAYVLTNLYASWQINEQLSSTFSVTNLFDKVYWANIDYANYGKPRQLTLTLNWRY